MGVMVSNPEKPLWPGTGDDKLLQRSELVQYHEAVGT